MAPSTFRKAIGAVKDHTSIVLAKVGNSSSFSDLEVAIVKATRHEEYPPHEKYIREILSLTSYSNAYIGASVAIIARRLSKTRDWVVALKALTLIERLLTEGDPAFEQEIFVSTIRGNRLLNMVDFQDSSNSNSWDFSVFIRTYALYLDEHLEFRMQGDRLKGSTLSNDDEEEFKEDGRKTEGVRATPVREMNNDRIFSRVHHLLQLLERFLECRPAGVARYNRVVTVALYPIVKESFQLYYNITQIISVLIDRFMQLDIPDSVEVYKIFCRVSKQFDELDGFYDICRSAGVTRSSEYPDIDKIPPKKLDVMDEFIREKSILVQKRMARISITKSEPTKEAKKLNPEEDMNSIKALPPSEGFPEDAENEQKEEEETKEKDNKTQEIGDLLNLDDDVTTADDHGNRMALALFDGGSAPTSTSTMTPWEAYRELDDWEVALVESASHLSNQRASFPRGFDPLILDGMYQHGAMAHAAASSGLMGSASSIALGSNGMPAMLALPAPQTGGATVSDPFAASVAVAPPAYVQMSEMEKKQRMLLQEQMMWQQYTRDGLQGRLYQNSYPYNTGGYMSTY